MRSFFRRIFGVFGTLPILNQFEKSCLRETSGGKYPRKQKQSLKNLLEEGVTWAWSSNPSSSFWISATYPWFKGPKKGLRRFPLLEILEDRTNPSWVASFGSLKNDMVFGTQGILGSHEAVLPLILKSDSSDDIKPFHVTFDITQGNDETKNFTYTFTDSPTTGVPITDSHPVNELLPDSRNLFYIHIAQVGQFTDVMENKASFKVKVTAGSYYDSKKKFLEESPSQFAVTPSTNRAQQVNISPYEAKPVAIVQDKVYDGDTKTLILSRYLDIPSYMPEKGQVKGGMANFLSPNVGVDKIVSVTDLSLEGTLDYVLSQKNYSAYATIKQKEVHGIWNPRNKNYDGNIFTTSQKTWLFGINEEDVSTVTLVIENPYFSSKNAGNHIVFPGNYYLSGLNAANYKIVDLNTPYADIFPKDLYIDYRVEKPFLDSAPFYDYEPNSVDYNSGIIKGDDFKCDILSVPENFKTEYNISGKDSGNYNVKMIYCLNSYGGPYTVENPVSTYANNNTFNSTLVGQELNQSGSLTYGKPSSIGNDISIPIDKYYIGYNGPNVDKKNGILVSYFVENLKDMDNISIAITDGLNNIIAKGPQATGIFWGDDRYVYIHCAQKNMYYGVVRGDSFFRVKFHLEYYYNGIVGNTRDFITIPFRVHINQLEVPISFKPTEKQIDGSFYINYSDLHIVFPHGYQGVDPEIIEGHLLSSLSDYKTVGQINFTPFNFFLKDDINLKINVSPQGNDPTSPYVNNNSLVDTTIVFQKDVIGKWEMKNKKYDGTYSAFVDYSYIDGILPLDLPGYQILFPFIGLLDDFNGTTSGVNLEVINPSFYNKDVGQSNAYSNQGFISGNGKNHYHLLNIENKKIGSIYPSPLNIMYDVIKKVYDGSSDATEFVNNILIYGFYNNETISIFCKSAKFQSINVGDNIPVDLIQYWLVGKSSSNYYIEKIATGNGSIIKALLTASYFALDKFENNQSDATVTDLDLLGYIVSGDKVQLNAVDPYFGKTEGIKEKEIGTYNVYATLSLSGASAGNYQIADVDIPTASILPLPLGLFDAQIGTLENHLVYGTQGTLGLNDAVLSFTLQSEQLPIDASSLGVYFAIAPTVSSLDQFTFAFTDSPDGGALIDSRHTTALSYDSINTFYLHVTQISRFTDVLSRNLSFSIQALSFGNVIATTPTTNRAQQINIAPYPIAPSPIVADKEYDGNRLGQVLNWVLNIPTDYPVGSTIISGGQAIFDTSIVGNNKPVTVTGQKISGTLNYVLESDVGLAHARIGKKTITGSWLANDKSYDQQANAVVQSTRLFGVIPIDGFDLDLSIVNPTFSSPNVGTWDVIPGDFGLTGSAAQNYNLVSLSNPQASITAISIQGNFSVSNKIYDGSFDATNYVSNPTLTGVLPGDHVGLNVNSAMFSQKTVGQNVYVSATQFSLSGPQAGNYYLSDVALAQADILPRPLVISGVSRSKTLGVVLNPNSKDFISSSLVPGQSALVLGDSISGVFLSSPGFASDATRGQYPISVSNAQGIGLGNYDITYQSSFLTVTSLLPGQRVGQAFRRTGQAYQNNYAIAALRADGSIAVWGDPGSGVIGSPSDSGFTQIYSAQGAFSALKSDGSIISWGDPSNGGTGAPAGTGFTQIFSNLNDFAALTNYGSIRAWGSTQANNAPFGIGFTNIFSNLFAFAALKENGQIASWGNSFYGGTGAPTGTGYVSIASTNYAFAAFKNDGSISTWGYGPYGGSGAPTGSGFIQIFNNGTAFAALKNDGSIVTWGDSSGGGVGAPTDSGYINIFANNGSFAALKKDGSIVSWGNASIGGTGSPTATGFQQIFANPSAFAALKSDGSIATWGTSSSGGSGGPTDSGYTQILSTSGGSFAALKNDGTIYAWGNSAYGGIGAPTGSGYTQIFSSSYSFTALKSDGSLFSWGSPYYGGAGTPTGNDFLTVNSVEVAQPYFAPGIGSHFEFEKGLPISQAFGAIGLDLSNTITSGELPPGITLDPNSGVLSGFPTSSGSFNFVMSSTNSQGTVQKSYTIQVSDKTVTSIASSSNPSKFGETINLKASVSCLIGTAVPTGDVTFVDGSIILGKATLDGSGIGVLSVNDLSLGNHTIIAQYSGGSGFLPSTSSSLEQIVNPPNQTITWDTPAPISLGTPISEKQLNASVAGALNGPAPGSLTYDVPLGTVFTKGIHTITVTASATSDYPSVTKSVSLLVIDSFADPHPTTGNGFGNSIVPLANGNVVITAPFDTAGGNGAGAVYLFKANTGELISSLVGTHSGDNVGLNGVTALANGNFLVRSSHWNNGSIANAGAVTFCKGSDAGNFTVNQDNSLIGGSANDQLGLWAPLALTNGNYVVRAPEWDREGIFDVGAVTFGNGGVGITGLITSKNSLIGTRTNDQIGSVGVKEIRFDIYHPELTIGNFVIQSPNWDNGSIEDAGAVTWASGLTGITGEVSDSNSIVGSTQNDQVGAGNLTVLANYNFVVSSPFWHNQGSTGSGAATWINGSNGKTVEDSFGVVSPDNSLVGSSSRSGDMVGKDGISALANGNYVVISSGWNQVRGALTWGDGTHGVIGELTNLNSLIGDAPGANVGSGGVTSLFNGNYVVTSMNWSNNKGAVTFGNGSLGTVGTVGMGTSLVGSVDNSYVGLDGVAVLSNDNYVIQSSRWSDGTYQSMGAATFGSATSGIKGVVSNSNSLVGSQENDSVGAKVVGLDNGNYVVISSSWSNGTAVGVGAVTWGDGTNGTAGQVSSLNSLVGITSGDQIGKGGIGSLNNGNYAVISPNWDNGSLIDAGAVTWARGYGPSTGVIDSSNSLVGTHSDDQIGSGGVTRLFANGNYVISSPKWDNDTATDVGAVTWVDGSKSSNGPITIANSLVGSTANDQIGSGGVVELINGNYVVNSPLWDNGSITDAGAVTWGNGSSGLTGLVSTGNSLYGTTSNDQIGNGAGVSIGQGIYSSNGGVVALNNGNFLVVSSNWTNGNLGNAGAVTWGNGSLGISGAVDGANSTIGSSANSGLRSISFNTFNDTYIVDFLSDGVGNRIAYGYQDPKGPNITSADHCSFAAGAFNSFTFQGTGSPTPVFSLLSGILPSGLTFDYKTGILSGTPGSESVGSYVITIRASNGLGADVDQSFTINIG